MFRQWNENLTDESSIETSELEDLREWQMVVPSFKDLMTSSKYQGIALHSRSHHPGRVIEAYPSSLNMFNGVGEGLLTMPGYIVGGSSGSLGYQGKEPCLFSLQKVQHEADSDSGAHEQDGKVQSRCGGSQ